MATEPDALSETDGGQVVDDAFREWWAQARYVTYGRFFDAFVAGWKSHDRYEDEQDLAAIEAARGEPTVAWEAVKAEMDARDAEIQAAENARLRAALEKAIQVLERTETLFHPKYLLHTVTLLEECKAVLAEPARAEEGASA